MMSYQNNPLIKLTGVWKKTSAKGNEYMIGRLGSAKLLILENREAGFDNEPDYILYLQTAEPKPAADADQSTSQAQHQTQPEQAQQAPQQAANSPPVRQPRQYRKKRDSGPDAGAVKNTMDYYRTAYKPLNDADAEFSEDAPF